MDKDMSLCMRGPAGDLDFTIPKDFPKTAYHPSRSMTRQSFAKDADINNIMAQYAVSGVLVDPSNVDSARVPRFGDFSDLVDYPTLVGRINQAQADFMTLPSGVRARFDNNVENLLDWIGDPKNVVEAVALKVLPESMIEATYAVHPELRPVEVKGPGVSQAGQAEGAPVTQ